MIQKTHVKIFSRYFYLSARTMPGETLLAKISGPKLGVTAVDHLQMLELFLEIDFLDVLSIYELSALNKRCQV